MSSESVFRAIAHPTRRRVLELLNRGDRSAGDLYDDPTISRPTLSEHLRFLRAAGLISARRKGTSLTYRLNRPAMREALTWTLQFRRRGSTRPDSAR